MAKVIIKMRVMPESTEVDLAELEKILREKIEAFTEIPVSAVAQSPVAFGLNALDLSFAMDESRGDTEVLENDIAKLEQVTSVEITSVSRALG